MRAGPGELFDGVQQCVSQGSRHVVIKRDIVGLTGDLIIKRDIVGLSRKADKLPSSVRD